MQQHEKTGYDIAALTSVFDYIKDLVFLMKVDGDSFRYFYLNQSALKVLNIDSRVVGRRIEDVMPPDYCYFLTEKYKSVLVSKSREEFVQEVETDKGIFIGETSLNPIQTEHGEFAFVLAIVRDITERKQNEQQLKISQKRLQSLIENNVDGVFELDLEGNFISINKMVMKITGYQESELIGKSFLPIIREDCLEDTIIHFKKAMNGENIRIDTSIHHKMGHTVHLFIKSIPIIIDNVLVGVYGIAKDITEEKHLQEELHEKTEKLRKSQEMYQLITENAFDVIKLISPTGVIKYVSPSDEKILGFSSSQTVGKPFTSFIHQDDLPLLSKRMNELIDGNNLSAVELRVQHKNGHYIWMEASTSPVVENGEISEFVTIARDVTEKKRLRDELEKAAFYDYLSGLPNRRVFDEQLQNEILKANCSNQMVAVMLLDGCKFKKINDTYGHDAGDGVIKEMAKRIKSCVRSTDTVVRMGGDEMAVIVSEMNSVGVAETIAQRIVKSFESPFLVDGRKIKMGIGIGIAFYPNHSVDKEKLVKYADIALYEAKRHGDNEYRVYNG